MGQVSISAFQAYNPADAASIVAGPFALYTVQVGDLLPTQMNEGFTEVDKKAAAFDLLTPSELQADLLTDVEPVVIGPGGQLYLTDGHHTFTALLDSIYGASDPTVYVNVIANFSNLTEAEFWATMQADNLLLPLNDGVPETVNTATGSPIPTSLTSLTSDVYRGLEYSILKNKSSKLFTTTSNITGAKGASTPGLDKMTGLYSDFLEAAAYQDALGGLGLPYLSPGDIALATQWNLNPNSTTTLPNVAGTVTAVQLPGFILNVNLVEGSGTNSSTTTYFAPGGISNATLASGALAGNGTFTGISEINAGTATNPILIGTPNVGFILELGNDAGNSVTLTGTNTYTGGTSILAGNLIVQSDASLGAAPTETTAGFDNSLTFNASDVPTNVLTAVQADNGIIFNSLTEGNGTLTIGTTAGGGTSTFTTNRPIAVDGETATINVNGYVVTLNGPLVSLGTNDVGLGNATGVSDLTIDDNSANEGKLILSTPSPDFFGNIIIGNNNSPTVEVMSDAALGNTGATVSNPAAIGEVELNGGTLQTGAPITASERNMFLGGGSTIDVDGNTTSWGSLTDVQRTLEIENSSTTSAGAIAFSSLTISATAILQLAGGSKGETVTFTNGIHRTAHDTLVIEPSTTTSLGTTEKVLNGVGASTLVDGIAPVWIVENNDVSKGAGPYDFVTYGANGYVKASYDSTATLSVATAAQVVALSGAATVSSNADVYALNTEAKNVTIGSGDTLTIGDGTDAAGLILGASGTISGGTLTFGSSEGVIWLGGAVSSSGAVPAEATISSQITGSGGLTFSGSGAVTIGTAASVSGAITIDSGTVVLSATNVFAGDVAGVLMANVKTKPSPAVLDVTANNTLTTLNTVGNNSQINLFNGATLTLGDTVNDLSSTIDATVTENGAATAGALTIDGSGLFDFSGGSKTALDLDSGSTIVVNNSAQLRIAASELASGVGVVLNGTSQLQLAENGGDTLADTVSGTGELHLIGGTLKITGTSNTYSGGTVVETGSTLDITTSNLPAVNPNITDAGGLIVFDQSTSGTYSGVISDGAQMGTGSVLSGSLDKDDSSGANKGNVTFTQVQAFTGETTIEAGTITLDAVNTLETSSGVDLGRVGGGAIASLALGANNTIQALSSEADNTTSVTLGGYTLTIDTAVGTDANFGGVISGTGAVVIEGSGAEVFSNADTYSGGTTVQSGTLELTGSGSLGSGAVTNDSAIELQASAGLAESAIANNAAIIAANGDSVIGTAGGSVTGSGTIAVGQNGTVELASAVNGNALLFLPNGSSEAIIIDNLAGSSFSSIEGFVAGDTLKLNVAGLGNGFTTIDGYTTAYDSANDTTALTLTSGGATVTTLTLAGNYSAAAFAFTTDSANANLIDITTDMAAATPPSLTLTVEQALTDLAALIQTSGLYSIVVLDTAGAVLANQAALGADPQITSVNVSDTAANVSANIDALNADTQIASITLTDGGLPALSLTVNQALNDTQALGEIVSPYTIAIADTAADVASNINALNANGNVSSITLTDIGTPTLTLTVAQALNDTTALGEITNASYAVAISDTAAQVAANIDALSADPHIASIGLTDTGTPTLTLTVAQVLNDAATLAEISTPYTIAISDTAANVAAHIDALNADAQISSISLTDGGVPTLTLTAAQALNDVAALAEISTPYTIAISDQAANIAAHIDALNADPSIVSITLTDGGVPALTLTVAQALDDTTALGEIASPYTIAISDSAANVAANIDALNADPSISSITLTDSGTPALTLSVAQAFDDTTVLGEITSSYTIAISDSAANVAAHIDALNADGQVSSITLTGAGTPTLTLSVAQALGDTTALGKITNASYAIAISDTAANVASHIDALNADSHVTSIALTNGGVPSLTLSVAQTLGDNNALGEITSPYTIAISDTAAHVAAHIDALNADANVVSIALTDGGVPALTLSVAQALGDTTVLDEIVSPYTIAISDTAANVAAHIAALNGDANISSITLTGGTLTLSVAQALGDTTVLDEITNTPLTIAISDTAANVAANIDALNADPSIGSITLTDGGTPILTLTVAQALDDTTALGKITNTSYAIAISDTAAEVSANIDALNADTKVTSITLTDSGTPTLSLTAAQALGDTRALGEITNTNYVIAVIDTAVDVSAHIDALNGDAKVASITLIDNGTLTLSVAQALGDSKALGEITNTTYSVAIVDTAANVSAQLAALNADPHITSISLTDTGTPTLTITISEALNDAKALGEIVTPHAVSIVDTAADIAAITLTQANALKAAGYTVLHTTGAVTLSVAEAALLAGDGLTVTGGAVTVTGSLATLLALTPAQVSAFAAAGYVLEAVDTPAHIEALSTAQIATLGALDVSEVASSSGSLAVTAAQALAFASTHIALAAPTGSTVSVSDTAAHLEALTASQIAGLSAIGVTSVSSINVGVVLSVAQAVAYEAAHINVSAPTGQKNSILDTPIDIETLTAGQIAGLPAIGISSISETGGTITLTVAQVLALETAGLSLSVPAGSAVVVSDTAANLETLTATQIAGLSALHVTQLTATGAGVTLNVAQALALISAGISVSVPGGDIVSVVDTATNIGVLTAAQIGQLSTLLHVKTVAANDRTVMLTVAQATAFESAGILLSAPTGQVVEVSDTAAHLEALTTAQISGLPASGISKLLSTTGTLTFTVAQTAALEKADLVVSAPGASAIVADTSGNLATLTATEIAGLKAAGITGVTSINGTVKFSVAQAVALEAAGISVTAPGGSIILSDTATNLASLTPAAITGLAALGVSSITSTDASVTLTVAQALAFEADRLKISAAGCDTVTISDTPANVQALTVSQIAGLSAVGVTMIDAGGSLTLSVAQTLALETAGVSLFVPNGDIVGVADTAANIDTLTPYEICGLAALGVTQVVATTAGATLSVAQAAALESAGITLSVPAGQSAAVTDTVANIEALTTTQITGLSALSVGEVTASNSGLAVTAAQAIAFENAHVSLAGPAGSTVGVSDTAGHLEALTASQLSALPSIGVTSLFSDNAGVSFTAAQTAAILSSDLSVTATGSNTVTENFANGGFSVFEKGALIEQKSVNADGSFDIAYFGVTGLGYSSYEDLYNNAGTKVAEAQDISTGSGTLVLYGNGLTTLDGAGALSATTGNDTFALNAHANEAITANGVGGETFEYTSGFGQSTISGLQVAGASHDVVQLQTSMFNYLTPTMTQTQDVTALLAHATQSGANVTIADTAGDVLTLNNTTKAALAANPSTLRFV